MDRADELLKTLTSAIEDNEYCIGNEWGSAVLSAIEAAGYVVGRMRWEGEGGSHLWLQSGGFGLAWVQVTNPGKANEMATAYLNSPSREKVGHFGSALEARAACEAAVRKAMRGE